MNVQIISDVHLEFHRDGGRTFLAELDPAGVDVLVVAGDFATLPLVRSGLSALCDKYSDVVYVLGNHEYYDVSPEQVHDELASITAILDNLHWLQHSAVEIGGVRIAGTTLWFPESPDADIYAPYMNDFQAIEGFVPWVYEEHDKARFFLQGEARRADVVVTHHLPSRSCVAPEFESSPLNRFFVGEVEHVLQQQATPALWTHGHTHSSVDLEIGRTRVVCNPFGYVGAENPEYDENLVIEIQPRTDEPVDPRL